MVLRPFISALLWAAILCFSTWPLYRRTLQLLGGRRTLAATLMTLLLAAILVAPFVVVGVSLSDNAAKLAVAMHRVLAEPPEPPAWLVGVPLVGTALQGYWQGLGQGSTDLMEELQKLLAPIGKWLLNAGLVFSEDVLKLSLSVFTTFFLYCDGAVIAARLDAGMARIAGARAHYLIELTGATVKGVVYGILGTALAQGIMAGLGFWVAGVPGPFLLGLLTFFLSPVPMGPPLVWLPASLWLFHQGVPGWGIFLILWGLFIGAGDHVLKPYLISQGSRLPFILVLLGILGGAVAFGFIGIFLGPTLLAVGYNLLWDWTLATPLASISAPPSSTTG